MSTDKIIITECGIDPEQINNSSLKNANRIVFIVSGRLIYRKGHELLMDAILRIPKDLDFECKIVGDGPELKRISRRIQENDFLNEHLVLTGKIPYTEMPKEYQTADVFIMPSIRETTGTVLLEAMANGLPIITINKFGGVVILDDKNAWLYSGKNRDEYIQGLANAMIYCINNPDEVKEKGDNARQKVAGYTWDKKDLFYQSIYERLINDSLKAEAEKKSSTSSISEGR
jgi:glycosyltransferase involved in cell wall biosynthesis